jgi:hypothetical protein
MVPLVWYLLSGVESIQAHVKLSSHTKYLHARELPVCLQDFHDPGCKDAHSCTIGMP